MRNKTAIKSAAPPLEPPYDVAAVRERLGALWGLERALTKAELARALKLSPEHGGDFLGKVERGKAHLSGSSEVAIAMMLNGAKPPTMDDVIKPGYPRGEVR